MYKDLNDLLRNDRKAQSYFLSLGEDKQGLLRENVDAVQTYDDLVKHTNK